MYRQPSSYLQWWTLKATAGTFGSGLWRALPLPLPATMDSLRYVTHFCMEVSVRWVIGRTWTLYIPKSKISREFLTWRVDIFEVYNMPKGNGWPKTLTNAQFIEIV